MSVLYYNGFIALAGKYKQHDLYTISQKGIEVIETINKDYEIVLSSFLTDNNIEL
jgi:hypothetical protein